MDLKPSGKKGTREPHNQAKKHHIHYGSPGHSPEEANTSNFTETELKLSKMITRTATEKTQHDYHVKSVQREKQEKLYNEIVEKSNDREDSENAKEKVKLIKNMLSNARDLFTTTEKSGDGQALARDAKIVTDIGKLARQTATSAAGDMCKHVFSTRKFKLSLEAFTMEEIASKIDERREAARGTEGMNKLLIEENSDEEEELFVDFGISKRPRPIFNEVGPDLGDLLRQISISSRDVVDNSLGTSEMLFGEDSDENLTVDLCIHAIQSKYSGNVESSDDSEDEDIEGLNEIEFLGVTQKQILEDPDIEILGNLQEPHPQKLNGEAQEDEEESLKPEEPWLIENYFMTLNHGYTLAFVKPNELKSNEESEPPEPKKRKLETKDERIKLKVKTVEEHSTSKEQVMSKELEYVRKCLKRELRDHGGKIKYYEFVIDPTDYGKTIENMFHTSFLIQTNHAGLAVDESNAPILYAMEKFEVNNIKAKVAAGKQDVLQIVNKIDYKTWKKLIKKLKIKRVLIGPMTVDPSFPKPIVLEDGGEMKPLLVE